MKRSSLNLLAVWVVSSVCSFAATNSWEGGDGQWEVKQNWSLNQRPDNTQQILITNTGTLTVTIDDQTASQFPNTMTVLGLALSNASGQSTLLLTNQPSSTSLMTFAVLNDARFESGSTLQMSDASSVGAGIVTQASNLLNNSSISIETNTWLLVTNDLSTASGNNQIGTLTTAGGTVVARAVTLGAGSGSLGTWTIFDGTNLVGETLQIGSDTGTGRVERSGGKLIIGGHAGASDFSIGASANSTGRVIFANGDLLVPSTVVSVGESGSGFLGVSNGMLHALGVDVGVGSGSHGRWVINGGTNNIDGYGVSVGLTAGSTGEVWMTGGTLNVPSGITSIGESGGVGALVISNGTLISGPMNIAWQFGSLGTMTIAGGEVAIPPNGSSNLLIGRGGTGVVWQTGGELTVMPVDQFTGRIELRNNYFGATMSQLVCSGGVLHAADVLVVHNSNGRSFWEVAGGTSVVDRAVYLLGESPEAATCLVSGGRLETRNVSVGTFLGSPDGGGLLTVAGGDVLITQGLLVDALIAPTSVVEVAGGQLTMTNLGATAVIGSTGAGKLVVSSGTFNAANVWLGGTSGSLGVLTVSGGTMRVYSSIDVGEYGTGDLSVLSNGNLDAILLRVGRQNGGVGTVTFQGGTLSGPAPRQFYNLEIGKSAGSTGAVWVIDGAVGFSQCAVVGGAGSGRFSATNSLLDLAPFSVGPNGFAEFFNCQLLPHVSGCSMINSNLIKLVSSAGTFSSSVQNHGTVSVEESMLTFNGFVQNTGTIFATNAIVRFAAGITNSGNVVLGPDQFRVTSVTAAGDDAIVSWQAFGGNRYRVQAASDADSVYGDISPEITAAGSGLVETNYVDPGALTNSLRRYYRVRQTF